MSDTETSGCFMGITPGDDPKSCGAPIWLPSETGGGYCREHAEEAAAEGLDMFTKNDAAAYLAKKAAES